MPRKKKHKLSNFLHAMPFGLSAYFQDPIAAILLNPREDGGTNDNVVNYLNVGCPNPTIQHDVAQSRTTIFNLTNNTLSYRTTSSFILLDQI